MRARNASILVATAAFVAICAAAPAQSAATTAPDAAAQTDLNSKKGDLSDKLDKSNGVIHPKGSVDPEIEKKAPPVGDTPVVRPPTDGSTVQPK